MNGTEQTVDLLLHHIAACVGTPWHAHGRRVGVGVDCAGLIVIAHNRAGLPVEDFLDYTIPVREALLEQQLARRFVRLESPRVGAVVRLGVGDRRRAQHLGFCVQGGFVHADPEVRPGGPARKRRVVFVRSPWSFRLVDAWMHPELI